MLLHQHAVLEIFHLFIYLLCVWNLLLITCIRSRNVEKNKCLKSVDFAQIYLDAENVDFDRYFHLRSPSNEPFYDLPPSFEASKRLSNTPFPYIPCHTYTGCLA